MQLMRVPSNKRREALPRGSSGYRYTPNTVLVQFSTMVAMPTNTLLAPRPTAWRSFRVVMEMPPEKKDDLKAMEEVIARELDLNFASFGAYCRDGLPDLYYDSNHKPVVVWNGSEHILSDDDIFSQICKGSTRERSEVLKRQESYFAKKKCFGYLDDFAAKHRSFRYHIRGVDVPTLEQLLPTAIALHKEECGRMCMYNLLRDRNPPRPDKRMNLSTFDPVVVHRWMHDHGHNVGALTDGLTPEDIQAHAEAFRYGHAALDITRSIILLHVPENPRKDLKTIAYTVVGDHAIPFSDPDVIKSIIQSAQARLGKRRMTNYSYYGKGTTPMDDNPPPTTTTRTNNQHRNRRRSMSVDRVFIADRASLSDQREENWRDDCPVDFEVEDREEEFEDTGSEASVRTGATYTKKTRKPKQYPLASQSERFRFFSKEHDKDFVRGRLRPDFQDGVDTSLIFYYVCTDETNIEFLYDYCIRVLSWDPTTAARSFNGRCTTLTIHNVIWTANPDIHPILHLHNLLHPKEPFRMAGVATYAYRMLYRELTKIGRYGTNLWDCMSQYPPNLQRLLDNHHPYHRPKLLQKTYHAPYAPVTHGNEGPEVLIPDAERRRLDNIRSYTACLLEMNDDRDQFPIHDATNVVVPFDLGLHGHLPIGHYLVDIPSQKEREARGTYEQWQRLPCFAADGEPRMMSHRFLKALLQRGLLTLTDIRLACVTDDHRQKQFGTALVCAFTNLITHIYQHPELQDPKNPCPKMLINHLVGLCNGTTLPHSGNRFVFRSLEEMYQLMLRIYTEDQIQKVHLKRVVGVDPYWDNTTYLHYELSTSGLTYRSFHLQPVYNVVLENQAIHVYDCMSTIPLNALIQVNIDAVEYRVRAADRMAVWVQKLDEQTVPLDTYQAAAPKDLLEQKLLGRWKPEAVKSIDKWKTYFYEYQNVRQETIIKRMLHDSDLRDSSPALEDPEHRDWVANWRSTLRTFQPGPGVRDEVFMHQICVDWFKEGETERTGLLLTGPAGTGKTHVLRRIYDYATHQGLNVVRTAFTHAACSQLGPDALTLSSLFGLDHRSDHRGIMVMSRRFAAHLRNLNIDVLIIDEISMIPFDILECLLLFHRMASQTRIILSGDFNQLPPVEPLRERPEGYNYFDTTDIFPYLVYDRVRNLGGRWLQLTECMRTDDPLLQEICVDPTYVSTRLSPSHFPVNPQQPIWRFVCFTNQTRRACNWYCMVRWLEAHPDANVYPFDLKEIYVHDKMNPPAAANGRVYPPRFDAAYYGKEFEAMMARFERGAWRTKKSTAGDAAMAHNSENQPVAPVPAAVKMCPKHWEYLQNFVYGEGMEVVARNTIRGGPRGSLGNADAVPMVVNNRRAVVRRIDATNRQITLAWLDILARLEAECKKRPRPMEQIDEINEFEEAEITLTFSDFAFNFTPGFCVTTHLAQGETIREHYGILDWNQIVQRNSMAYVAVTRAAHPSLLHIVANYFSDPWDVRSNADVGVNVLRKLYHWFKSDYDNQLAWHRIPLDLYRTWKKRLLDALEANQTLFCAHCKAPLKLKGYLDTDAAQFSLALRYQWWTTSSSSETATPENLDDAQPEIFDLVCKTCHCRAIEDRRGPRPGDVSKKFPTTK